MFKKHKTLMGVMGKRLEFVDLVWIVVITSAIATGFCVKLLLDASDINQFLSWGYVATIENAIHLGSTIIASLSIYLLFSFFNFPRD